MARQRSDRGHEETRSRARSAARWPALIVALVTLCTGLVVAPVSPALANPSTGFNPGNIISDTSFYQGNAMTAAQVQSFLAQRVPRCTIGDPGKPPGGTYYFPGGGSTTLAQKCLKDAVLPSRSMASNPYCSSYVGSSGESAATIIQKVGQACGISQRVLLVMLEKEQSLVQDDFPAQHQFDRAMGYACPDSGPGGSANCDTQYYGFFNQVYYAAWQYKVYRAFPDSYRYKPFQTNSIQWHPNLGCGTSNVYIENRATASLYIYTPYRPNQAALNAGWGTGDACSSYGNRNFYNFYNTWFGSPTVSVAAEFTSLYSQLGGATGAYGEPRKNAVQLNGGVLQQEFAGGTMYWSQGTGASAIRGALRTAHLAAGGVDGRYGVPRGVEARQSDGGYAQEFTRGTATWTSSTGVGFTKGAIRAMYLAARETGASLGSAIGEERAQPGGVYVQEFTRGTAYWSSRTGAAFVRGAIRTAYHAAGAASSPYGLPIEREQARTGGYAQEFQRGRAFWSQTTGAAFVKGAILTEYRALAETGFDLGFPAGDEQSLLPGVYHQPFGNGVLSWSGATGTVLVKGGIRRTFDELGGLSGVLGQPLTNEARQANGAYRQDFRGGSLIWSAQYGAVPVKGAIRTQFLAFQGTSSDLGHPRTIEVPFLSGYRQDFSTGTLVWSRDAGAVPLRGAIGTAYLNDPALQTKLGVPVSAEAWNTGGYEQRFAGGILRWTSATGVTVLDLSGGPARGSSLAVSPLTNEQSGLAPDRVQDTGVEPHSPGESGQSDAEDSAQDADGVDAGLGVSFSN